MNKCEQKKQGENIMKRRHALGLIPLSISGMSGMVQKAFSQEIPAMKKPMNRSE